MFFKKKTCMNAYVKNFFSSFQVLRKKNLLTSLVSSKVNSSKYQQNYLDKKTQEDMKIWYQVFIYRQVVRNKTSCFQIIFMCINLIFHAKQFNAIARFDAKDSLHVAGAWQSVKLWAVTSAARRICPSPNRASSLELVLDVVRTWGYL